MAVVTTRTIAEDVKHVSLKHQETYLLNRDTEESRRLNYQHELWTKTQGYLIHPEIETALPTNARIADIATGTGVWLTELAKSPSAKAWQFDGFDISRAQFPHESTLPSNIHLHIADMKQPFPPQFHGQFDLVHVRLVILAFEEADWPAAVANVLQLLRPGGWIQWEEAENNPTRFALRSKLGAQTRNLQRGIDFMFDVAGDALLHCSQRLYTALQDAAVRDVSRDVVSSDRLLDVRVPMTRNLMGVIRGVSTRCLADGKGNTTKEDIDDLMVGMEQDVNSGGYLILFLHCLIGRVE